MRRAAGAHIRSNRAKLLILKTHGIDSKMGSLNNAAKLKMLPPSLKASEIKRIMKEQSTEEAPAIGAQEIAPKPRKIRRKHSIMGKDESPRSGLRPQHTHSTVRSQSVYGLLSTNKIQAEYRKLSDFGLLPPSCAPVSLTVPHSAPASPKDRMELTLEMPSSEDISPVSRSNRSASPPLVRLPSLDPPSVLVDDDGTLDPELLAPIDPNSPSRTSLRQKIRSLKINGNQAVSSFRRSIRFNENATVRRFQTSFRRKKTNEDETRSLGTQSSVSDKDRRSMSLKRGSVSSEDIKSVVLEEVYDLQKEICSGRFGYAMEAVHKASSQKIALKFFPKTQTKQCDFLREYTYSYFLSPHPNIIDTYEGTFSTNDDSAYFFVQEACPGTTLRETVEASRSGIGDDNTRKVIMSVLSAIEYMHDEGLAHRNLKAENVMIFGEHFEKVKVSDFGLTRRVGSNVKYLEFVNSYQAPELCETVQNEVLTVGKSMDIWAIGILLYFCLKARFPWQKASIMCKPYWEWEQWLKGKNPALPRRWLAFSEKTLKVMKKTLNPREKDRWTTKEIRKIVAKERLLKPPKPDFNDDFVYVPSKPSRRPKKSKNEKKKKSALQQWLCATLHTMSEISEQMVSARDDDE